MADFNVRAGGRRSLAVGKVEGNVRVAQSVRGFQRIDFPDDRRTESWKLMRRLGPWLSGLMAICLVASYAPEMRRPSLAGLTSLLVGMFVVQLIASPLMSAMLTPFAHHVFHAPIKRKLGYDVRRPSPRRRRRRCGGVGLRRS